MYTATIEPRLIALLNDQPTTPTSRLDLPPLQDPNVLKASGRPHALEPNAHTSNHKDDRSNANPSSQKISQILSAEPASMSRDNNGPSSKDNTETERALGLSSPQSLRKILQTDDESPSQRSASKKRSRIDATGTDSHKDDFVQLPQPPPKKQKAPKQVVPPIIIGLFEPPPNAALFPPIASSAFHDSHGRNTLNVNVPTEKGKEKERAKNSIHDVRTHAMPKVNNHINESINGHKSTGLKSSDNTKPQMISTTAPRKKWSKEETNQLLLGVHKYGIGKWKLILNDTIFKFNDRSPADLKDRFRTCCPAEIREQVKNGKKSAKDSIGTVEQENPSPATEETPKSSRGTSSLMFEGILTESTSDPATKSNTQSRTVSPEKIPPPKSRAHRRKLCDLESLGISGPLPFKKSERRERRPFSEEEDNNIMTGYSKYGPQWAKIQSDPDFGFHDRRSTDIRDRFRNRWKGVYETLGSGESPSKAGKSSTTSKGDLATTRSGATSISSSLQSTEIVGSSEKAKNQRGPSATDLMTLSSNAISNPYPLPTISSQPNTLHGKEIFYQLPNPNSTASSSNPSSTSTSLESILASSNSEQASFSSNDWNDNILAPFNANALGVAHGMGIENGIGVEEIVASFNPSSVGEMDIQRFLLDDSWPLK